MLISYASVPVFDGTTGKVVSYVRVPLDSLFSNKTTATFSCLIEDMARASISTR